MCCRVNSVRQRRLLRRYSGDRSSGSRYAQPDFQTNAEMCRRHIFLSRESGRSCSPSTKRRMSIQQCRGSASTPLSRSSGTGSVQIAGAESGLHGRVGSSGHSSATSWFASSTCCWVTERTPTAPRLSRWCASNAVSSSEDERLRRPGLFSRFFSAVLRTKAELIGEGGNALSVFAC